MVKKSGFLKHGDVLRRMLKSKSGQSPTAEEERKAEERMSEEQRRSSEEREENIRAGERRRRDRSYQQETGDEQAKREHDFRVASKKWEKKEKEDEDAEAKRKRIEKGRLKRARDWTRQKPKEVLRGTWEGAGKNASGWMFILMTVLLYVFDIFFRYNGINVQRFLDNLRFTGIESYIGWFFNSIVLTLLIAYYIIYRRTINEYPQEFISWFLVAETISLIIFMGGMGNMLIHLALVIAFYFLYIRNAAPGGSIASANYIFFFLLVFDFFGFGILAEFVKNPIISNRLIIPIWFYFALIYTHEQDRSFAINLVIILVILMNVFYFVGGINGLQNMSATLTAQETQEGVNFVLTSWNNVFDTIGKAFDSWQDELDKRLEYATGGYYKGKVERNKIGPLGVFIDKLMASQPRYYEKEDVIIWGTVKALSLGGGINVNVSCHKEDEEEYATKTVPRLEDQQPFVMYSRETRDFECVFEYLETPWFADFGIHTITVDAGFNFGTLAYLKSYFMDIERKRGMVREGLDPFKEFGIKDTNPIAVYTDGPVIIGMETTSPIIEVGEGIITQPRVGITLENKEGWEGVIRGLSELVLLTPPGVEISQPDSDCTVGFKEYKQSECEETSCQKFVKEPCEKACGKLTDTKAEDRCNEQCEKTLGDCKKDCGILFEGEKDSKYKGYALDISKIDNKDIFKDIDRYRSFSCRLDVKENVLGNTPLTVKYFRANARYDYVISKDIDVQIQSEGGTGAKVSEKVDTTKLVPGHIDEKIRYYAMSQDTVDLALALAWTESNHRHCCEDKDKRWASNCKGTEESSCEEGRLISSGSSFGVMQLNKEVHCPWFYPKDICENGVAKEGVEYSKYGCKPEYTKEMANGECKIYGEAGCDGKSATNVDCNIKLGLTLLKNYYNQYKGGIQKGDITCTDEETIKKYLGYVEWDAALRAYNGRGCPDEESKGYVETVNDYLKNKPWEENEKT